jgi:peroxiredoxin
MAPTARPAPPAPTLPAIELVTLDGQPARLDAAVGGHAALLSLWATWCDACAKEFDALIRLDARARTRGALVLGVAVGEPRQTVARFVAWRQLSYPSLVDEQFVLADALGEKRVPTTLVVDRGGRVVYTGGALDEPALAALESLTSDRSTAADPKL